MCAQVGCATDVLSIGAMLDGISPAQQHTRIIFKMLTSDFVAAALSV
jgi:hypothetical protein